MQASELPAVIEEEIARLERARALLAGDERGPADHERPAGAFSGFAAGGSALRRRRTISAAGRARMAAAQKADWAKVKRAAKRAAAAASGNAVVKPKALKAKKNAPPNRVKSRKKDLALLESGLAFSLSEGGGAAA
jgi:hypothetical protein